MIWAIVYMSVYLYTGVLNYEIIRHMRVDPNVS